MFCNKTQKGEGTEIVKMQLVKMLFKKKLVGYLDPQSFGEQAKI